MSLDRFGGRSSVCGWPAAPAPWVPLNPALLSPHITLWAKERQRRVGKMMSRTWTERVVLKTRLKYIRRRCWYSSTETRLTSAMNAGRINSIESTCSSWSTIVGRTDPYSSFCTESAMTTLINWSLPPGRQCKYMPITVLTRGYFTKSAERVSWSRRDYTGAVLVSFAFIWIVLNFVFFCAVIFSASCTLVADIASRKHPLRSVCLNDLILTCHKLSSAHGLTCFQRHSSVGLDFFGRLSAWPGSWT